MQMNVLFKSRLMTGIFQKNEKRILLIWQNYMVGKQVGKCINNSRIERYRPEKVVNALSIHKGYSSYEIFYHTRISLTTNFLL